MRSFNMNLSDFLEVEVKINNIILKGEKIL